MFSFLYIVDITSLNCILLKAIVRSICRNIKIASTVAVKALNHHQVLQSVAFLANTSAFLKSIYLGSSQHNPGFVSYFFHSFLFCTLLSIPLFPLLLCLPTPRLAMFLLIFLYILVIVGFIVIFSFIISMGLFLVMCHVHFIHISQLFLFPVNLQFLC